MGFKFEILYGPIAYMGEVKTISVSFVFPFAVKMIEIEMTLLILFFSTLLPLEVKELPELDGLPFICQLHLM